MSRRVGSHRAQGSQEQALEELWPLLRFVLPTTWQHVHAGVRDLLSEEHELLPDVVGRIQVSASSAFP